MFASAKILGMAHAAAVKIAAAKSAVGVGALVGSAATGLIAAEQLGPDYVHGATAYINLAIYAETGRAESPLTTPQPAHIRAYESWEGVKSKNTEILSDIPQVTVTAKRLTMSQRVAFDADKRLQMMVAMH